MRLWRPWKATAMATMQHAGRRQRRRLSGLGQRMVAAGAGAVEKPCSTFYSSSFSNGRCCYGILSLAAAPAPAASTNSTTTTTSFGGRKRGMVHVARTTTTTTTNDQTTSSSDNHDINPTKLVDGLLQYTETLMTASGNSSSCSRDDETDDTQGIQPIQPQPVPVFHHLIAFSGGIDSSVVTALIHQVQQSHLDQQQQQQHRVTAVLGTGPALSAEQRQLAERIAVHHIGVEHFEMIPTTEGDDELYRRNDGRACWACKTHLYTCLNSIAAHYKCIDNNSDNNGNAILHHHHRLYNGTNADDLLDPTRLGLMAATNFDVQSPLQHTPKAHVRIAGKHLGLPNWNYAASPCLRSRLAMGVAAVPEHLRRIEQAEAFVKKQLLLLQSSSSQPHSLPSWSPSTNLRVRLLAQQKAVIEIDAEWVECVRECLENKEEEDSSSSSWQTMFVQTLGFRSVDVRPFQTGSVAANVSTTQEAMAELSVS